MGFLVTVHEKWVGCNSDILASSFIIWGAWAVFELRSRCSVALESWDSKSIGANGDSGAMEHWCLMVFTITTRYKGCEVLLGPFFLGPLSFILFSLPFLFSYLFICLWRGTFDAFGL